MCYIFTQNFPFHGELRKDKIATWLRLPSAVFLSPPSFWEARDQPEAGSFFPRMKGLGNEVSSIGVMDRWILFIYANRFKGIETGF